MSLRKVQQDYIEAAAGALTQDHKVALISAETGVQENGYPVPALLILLKNPEAKFVMATIVMPDAPDIQKRCPSLNDIAEQCGMNAFSGLWGKQLRIPGESTWTVTHRRFTDLDTVKVLKTR